MRNFSYLCKKIRQMKTCGNFVKEMRRQYGLTQEQLAAKTGVGLRFMRELEADKPTLRMDKVNMVLEMFGAELGVVPFEKDAPRARRKG